MGVGTVNIGAPAATITGLAPNQLLNLTFPNSPAGGLTGQVLTKNSNSDYDTKWASYNNVIAKRGPGRPDKMSTTAGNINGSEPIGTTYTSTDGANVGAWVWTKTKLGGLDTWVVTVGDTGYVILTSNPNTITGGKIVVRRVNNIVFLSLGYEGPYGTYGISSTPAWTIHNNTYKLNITTVPTGYRTDTAQFAMITNDGFDIRINVVLNVLTISDKSYVQLRFPDVTAANSVVGALLLRTPRLQWITADAWPDSI